MYYQQFQPHPMLKPFVQCYWTVSDPSGSLPASEHGVIPGGYVDMIFNVGDTVYLSDSGGIFTDKAKSFVAGPLDHFQRFRVAGEFKYLGVRFHLGKYPFSSTGFQLGKARNRAVPLDLVCADAGLKATIQALELRLAQVTEPTKQMACVEQFLIRFIQYWKAPDAWVTNALGLIEETQGQISVEALATALQISTRQLERKFTEQVGLPPKSFCRLTRFHQVKSLIENAHKPSVCDLAYECGYYDQTHLIREFRLFTGQTPARFESVQPVGFFLYDW